MSVSFHQALINVLCKRIAETDHRNCSICESCCYFLANPSTRVDVSVCYNRSRLCMRRHETLVLLHCLRRYTGQRDVAALVARSYFALLAGTYSTAETIRAYYSSYCLYQQPLLIAHLDTPEGRAALIFLLRDHAFDYWAMVSCYEKLREERAHLPPPHEASTDPAMKEAILGLRDWIKMR